MSLKIKEEVTKQIKAKVLRVVEYPTRLASIVPAKKDGKARILMDEEDVEKTTFITPWGVYYYKMIPCGLKNAGATYMRAMTTIFDDMIYKKIEVYVDDVIIKSKMATDYIADLRKFFDRIRRATKVVGIGAVLVSETSHHYPVSAKLRFPCTKNMAEYEACILGLNMVVDMNVLELLVIGDLDLLVHQVQGEWATENSKILPYLHHVQELRKMFRNIKFRHVPGIQNEFAVALATLSSMIKHPDKNYIIPFRGGNLYKRTPDLALLRCVGAKEASKLLEDVHAGTCGPHMNDFVLEVEHNNAKWMRGRYDQLDLINEKMMNAICHSQLYQNRMSRAFNKSVKPRQFAPGQLVLKKIFPHQDEAKGKFSANWKGPYMIHRVLTRGALILVEMDGEIWPKPINSNAVKRYYA
ncbi:uncharacterized protein [Nicotiana sylvestris]|uniref:uncharacterized protein n=1 Tax=Nicotiana sylvestris TaxID=4096 RepID=UPI00388C5F33